jgi:hypothetical protein
MSRIILAFYPGTDEQHLVVGWDRPLATYYWQEFNKEPEADPKTGDVKWEDHPDWEEMIQVKGYWPNELPTMQSFMNSLPEKFKPLVTEEVQRLLNQHSMNPNSGRIVVDLSTNKEA